MTPGEPTKRQRFLRDRRAQDKEIQTVRRKNDHRRIDRPARSAEAHTHLGLGSNVIQMCCVNQELSRSPAGLSLSRGSIAVAVIW